VTARDPRLVVKRVEIAGKPAPFRIDDRGEVLLDMPIVVMSHEEMLVYLYPVYSDTPCACESYRLAPGPVAAGTPLRWTRHEYYLIFKREQQQPSRRGELS